jgi:DNA-directed RNA polymerase sigma subunit (sigma70/sigma32)
MPGAGRSDRHRSGCDSSSRPLLQPHPFREIPVRMGVTKGRVSQLHHDALNRLRDVMRELR